MRRLPVIGGLALVLVALGLMLLLRDFVRQTITPPLAYLLWLFDLALRSVPQSVYWALIVAGVAVFALRSLAAGRARASADAPHVAPLVLALAHRAPMSPLQQRVEQIAHLDTSAFAREKIAFELRALLLQVLAYRERQPAADIERRIRSGALDVPPHVRRLVVDWQSWLPGPPPAHAVKRWLAFLRPARLAEKGRRGAGDAERETWSRSGGEEVLMEVVAYLESLLGSTSMEEQQHG